MGGGGAGGSVLLSINQFLDNTATEIKGGKGADMTGSVPLGGRIGGGGGGSGGLLFSRALQYQLIQLIQLQAAPTAFLRKMPVVHGELLQVKMD